ALVPYKRIGLAIGAARRLGRRLRIVGTGPEERRLKALAGPGVEFLGWRDDREVAELYARCRAVLFPAVEDFGAVPLRAPAAGGSSARGSHAEGPLASPRALGTRRRPLPDRGLLGVRLRDPVPPAAGDRRAAVPRLRAPAPAHPGRVGLRVPCVRPVPAEPPGLASLRVVPCGHRLHARRAGPHRDHDLRLPWLRVLA